MDGNQKRSGFWIGSLTNDKMNSINTFFIQNKVANLAGANLEIERRIASIIKKFRKKTAKSVNCC